MTNKELLISRLNLLSEEDITSLLDAANHMEGKNALAAKPDCPYCGSHTVICYGHKCRKQRFFCKSCGRTFVPTTHTIMSNSHFPAATRYMATPLTTRHKSLAVPTRRSLI